jgi:hypothetical protein
VGGGRAARIRHPHVGRSPERLAGGADACGAARAALGEALRQRLMLATVKFSWDPAKSRENKKKHGVSFEEAREVFTSA